MKRSGRLIIAVLLLLISGISPNLFVVAQAGLASFQFLILYVLLPSTALFFLILGLAAYLGYNELPRQVFNGIMAGLVATVGLEIIREIGFRLGTMPGDLPRLMGVLALNQFSSGPDFRSDVAGWAYHFWNGADFGIIFSLLFGGPKIWYGTVYGLLIGIGFMISPVVRALGIGFFGTEFKGGYVFALTVTIAHLAFGVILGLLLRRLNKGAASFLHSYVMER